MSVFRVLESRLDLPGSRDVIGHVTIRLVIRAFPICSPLEELRRYRPRTISAMTISATDEISHRPHRPQPIQYRPQAIYIKKCSVFATEYGLTEIMDNSFSSCFYV